MIVKNEGNKIKDWIWKILHLFDDVVIVDTGSTDNTISELNQIWINPISYNINHSDQRLVDARNLSIEKNKCEWILVLDGDETITADDIQKIKNFTPSDETWGYFIKRLDYRYENEFEDYKMCLLKKNSVRFLFSVHACPQVYLRDNWGTAERLNWITLYHYPEHKTYRENYLEQLNNWVSENPWCLRFYRFMGYHHFKNWNKSEALECLKIIISNQNIRFPVETLNAYMISATISQLNSDNLLSFQLISHALNFYKLVESDFEVKINFRLKKWLLNAQEELIRNPNTYLIPYEFAY